MLLKSFKVSTKICWLLSFRYEKLRNLACQRKWIYALGYTKCHSFQHSRYFCLLKDKTRRRDCLVRLVTISSYSWAWLLKSISKMSLKMNDYRQQKWTHRSCRGSVQLLVKNRCRFRSRREKSKLCLNFHSFSRHLWNLISLPTHKCLCTN